jgi:general secretion pathway protein G
LIRAFTLIELVFIIVVLGILGAVAFPKFVPYIEDAYIAKAKAKVDTIRSGLQNDRSKRLMKGEGGDYPFPLESNASSLFCKVAECEPSGTGAGHWERISKDDNARIENYSFHAGSSTTITFQYDASDGTFRCLSPTNLCKEF